MTLRRIEMRSSQPPRLGIIGRLPVFLLIMVLTLAVVLTPTARAAPAAGDWIVETVDDGGGILVNVGIHTSIAVDSSDAVHISYSDQTAKDLKYATNAGGSWISEVVDSNGDVGNYSSIAVGADGSVHIAYYDMTNGDLKYATNAGGSWNAQTVDSNGNVGWFTSIALDAQGKVHISYLDFGNGDLKYATNAGGSWKNTTVDRISDVGGYSSIAIGTDGKVYIGYFDFFQHDLKYATNAGGSWVNTTVDTEGDVGGYCSMALDSQNKAHFSYFDNDTIDLKYATNADGSWKNTTVDSSGDVGQYSCIAVDSNDKAHISYYNNASGDLKYATNAGGSWKNVTVDSTNSVGRFTSIAVDSRDKAHISYYDSTNGDLKYATQAVEPSAPLELEATASNGAIDLTWTAPQKDGSSPVIGYNIYRGTTLGSETLLERIGNVTSYDDSGLTNGQKYYYKVSANNSVGEGPLSEEVSATPVTTPDAPVNLVATAGNAKVTLSWDAPSDSGGGAITHYKIYRGTTAGSETLLKTVDNVLSYADSGLTTAQTYYYKVSAVNVAGEGPLSTEVSSLACTVPSAPQGFTAAGGDGKMVLTWSAPDNGGSAITAYKVYRDGTLIATLGNEFTYTDTGLTNGQTYSYKVTAVNSIGESAPTLEVSDKAVAPSGDMTLIILIVAIVAIVGISVGLLYMRKKKKI